MTTAIFPGTFDPIHCGHIDIAVRASRLFEELVIAVYDRPLKNLLFSPDERYELAREAFANQGNISVSLFSGLTVDYCHESGARVSVSDRRFLSDCEMEFRMALANHRLAPDIEVIALITHEAHSFISGSSVKEIASLGGDVSSMVPPHVDKALSDRFHQMGPGSEADEHAVSLRD